jgi:hypothetical protein
MVNKDKSYMILTRIAVPTDMMDLIAKNALSIDYSYEGDGYEYYPKGAISDVTLISGEQLLANQIAQRMKKENK